MNDDLEDLQVEFEKAHIKAANLEKKQKKVDQEINEWKLKCEQIQIELEKSQTDARNFSSEVLKLRGANEDMEDRLVILTRENKTYFIELESVRLQLTEGGKNAVELDKARRKLLADNEDMQLALEEAETALGQEEAKLLKI